MIFFQKATTAIIIVHITMFFSTGCNPEVNCDDLGSKLNRCRDELYTEMAPSPATLLNKITSSSKSKISAHSRKNLRMIWREKRKELSTQMVDEIIQRCTKNKGRFHIAEDINECLKHDECINFAKCFKKAVEKKP